jgi:hypothetical protein
VRSSIPAWKLVGFEERFDAWADLDNPSQDLRVVVMEWVIGRHDDPYQGVRREAGFPNLWFGKIPHSEDGKGHAVAGPYWIEESTRTVRCESFSALREPI